MVWGLHTCCIRTPKLIETNWYTSSFSNFDALYSTAPKACVSGQGFLFVQSVCRPAQHTKRFGVFGTPCIFTRGWNLYRLIMKASISFNTAVICLRFQYIRSFFMKTIFVTTKIYIMKKIISIYRNSELQIFINNLMYCLYPWFLKCFIFIYWFLYLLNKHYFHIVTISQLYYNVTLFKRYKIQKK